MPKPRSKLRWVLAALRFALCAFAIAYLYYNVHWNDQVRLEGERKPVRLVAEDPGGFEIQRPDGRREWVTQDRVARVGATGALDVEYGVVTVARQLRMGYALAALLLFAPVPFMAAQRLVWMLAIQSVRLTSWEAVKLTFVGNFFNFALPGTTGGDLIKAYYVTRYTRHKTEAITTVFLDRVVGLLGLMMLASVMFLFSRTVIAWEPQLYGYIAGGLSLVWAALAAGSIVVFSRRLRTLIRLPALAARLPAGEHLLRVGRATVAMRQHPYLVTLSLLNTVGLQLLVVVSAWVMSLALGMSGGFVLYFIGVPIGFLIGAIPIAPPQAFGVMEVAYLAFFTQSGLNAPSQAFALALAVRVIQLVWALPGVLVPLLGAHVPQRRELEELSQAEAAAVEGPPSPATAAPSKGLGAPSRVARRA